MFSANGLDEAACEEHLPLPCQRESSVETDDLVPSRRKSYILRQKTAKED